MIATPMSEQELKAGKVKIGKLLSDWSGENAANAPKAARLVREMVLKWKNDYTQGKLVGQKQKQPPPASRRE